MGVPNAFEETSVSRGVGEWRARRIDEAEVSDRIGTGVISAEGVDVPGRVRHTCLTP